MAIGNRNNYMTVVVLINDKFNIVYLDNVIFHRLQRRLSGRNYGSRRRRRYLIFLKLSICCCEMRLPTGLCPGRDPPGGLPLIWAYSTPNWQTLGLTIAEGHAELRAPGPRDPTIGHCSCRKMLKSTIMLIGITCFL